jgi:hypothetical protein
MSTPKTPMGVFLTGFSTDLPTGVDETLWTGENEAHVERTHFWTPPRRGCSHHHYSLAHAGLRRARSRRLQGGFFISQIPL